VHERSFWTALNRALAGVKSGPELSQRAVGVALPLSLAMFALMVPGQRGGGAVIAARPCALTLSRPRGRAGESGAGVWTLRFFMWEDLTVL